jgi:hypothetical protein
MPNHQSTAFIELEDPSSLLLQQLTTRIVSQIE